MPVPPEAFIPALTPPPHEMRPRRAWLRIPIVRPRLTYIILATLILIYIPTLVSDEWQRRFLIYGAKINTEIVAGEWWRLITATFLHGPPIHMLLNGYALLMIGSEVESCFGRARFAVIYFLSGFAGGVASFAFSQAPGVGASGAIFGLIGALAVYFGLQRRLFGKLGHAQFWNIIFVIVLNVGIGFSGFFPIDNSAHLGGLVAGAALGYVLVPRYAFGDWSLPHVRDLVDTNGGGRVWAVVGLIAVDLVLAFFLVLLLYKAGILELF